MAQSGGPRLEVCGERVQLPFLAPPGGDEHAPGGGPLDDPGVPRRPGRFTGLAQPSVGEVEPPDGHLPHGRVRERTRQLGERAGLACELEPAVGEGAACLLVPELERRMAPVGKGAQLLVVVAAEPLDRAA